MPEFLEERLDPRITRGAQGGPTVVGRTKVYSLSGALTQTFLTFLPIHRYEASHGVRTAADFQAILNLWYVVMFTPYIGFRWKDWRDYLANTTNTVALFLQGSTTQLQLYRVYTFKGVSFHRPITKPVNAALFRTRAGVTSQITSTLDTTTGIATISGHASGDTYSWVGEFDVPVTFSDDEWNAELQVSTENLHVVSGSIRIEEIRL